MAENSKNSKFNKILEVKSGEFASMISQCLVNPFFISFPQSTLILLNFNRANTWTDFFFRGGWGIRVGIALSTHTCLT